MKKDKISFIKTNLISFTIVGLLCIGIGVYAAVTFPSNEVSYDNSSSGLKSTNVKGAIDELYTVCTSKTPAEEIIENAKLEKDPYECRYFFTGANPNNYITFNNEKAGWRIISAECDGTIKIMKNTILNDINWNSSGTNNWTTASLNTYLNGTYYNSLNSTAKSQIVAHDWGIGAVTNNNNDLADQINDENATKWNGKIALPTASEIIRTNSNQTGCGTIKKLTDNYNSANSNKCDSTIWANITGWTLSANSNATDTVYLNFGGLIFFNTSVNDTIYGDVLPTVYLSSNIKITGGNGSSSNPYTIN